MGLRDDERSDLSDVWAQLVQLCAGHHPGRVDRHQKAWRVLDDFTQWSWQQVARVDIVGDQPKDVVCLVGRRHADHDVGR